MSAALQWLRPSPRDSVAVALVDLPAGAELIDGVKTIEAIRAGHKVALRRHATGEPVIKLGQPIGIASVDIAPGAHVHTHNLRFAGQADRDVVGTSILHPAPISASFMGYVRDDGRVGTRNYVGVLTSVNCSATVARRVAAHFTPDRLADCPNVDGVVAFSHMSGCGMAREGRGIDNLRRTIGGYASHPKFAAVLMIGLGCEVNQIGALLTSEGLAVSERLETLNIQDAGGTRDAIAAGVAAVEAMLPGANAAQREPVSAAHLTIGLQCGASDGYSALTANPALGPRVGQDRRGRGQSRVVGDARDLRRRNLLLERAASPQVAQALIDGCIGGRTMPPRTVPTSTTILRPAISRAGLRRYWKSRWERSPRQLHSVKRRDRLCRADCAPGLSFHGHAGL